MRGDIPPAPNALDQTIHRQSGMAFLMKWGASRIHPQMPELPEAASRLIQSDIVRHRAEACLLETKVACAEKAPSAN